MRLALLLAALAQTSPAADAPAPRAEQEAIAGQTMHAYFAGEQAESWAWNGFGVASVGAGVGLAVRGDTTLRFLSIPLLLFGAVELLLGVGLAVRTPPQVAALDAQLSADPAGFTAAERARMRRVNRGFVVYRLVELAALSAGATTAGFGWIGNDQRALGLGLGLVVESALFLLLDFFADARGGDYERALRGFSF